MKTRICLILLTVFFLTLVVGRFTGDPDVDVFYVEKTLVSEPCEAIGTYTDYDGELLSHNGNYYICYSSDKRNRLTDDAVDDALENILGDQIGYVYGNNEIFWATFSDELDKVTDIGLIYQVKGYDESEAVAILYDSYLKPIDIVESDWTTPSESNGKNLHLFKIYDVEDI